MGSFLAFFKKKFKYVSFIPPHLYTNRKALLAKKVPKIKQLRLVKKINFLISYLQGHVLINHHGLYFFLIALYKIIYSLYIIKDMFLKKYRGFLLFLSKILKNIFAPLYY